MTERVITIYPDMSISDAAATMEKNGIRGLPVTTPQGDLVGIVTSSDVLQTHPDQRSKKTVATIMSKDIVVTYPNEYLSVVLEKMTGNQIGRLPVVNPGKEKRLVGIITREDIWRIYRIEVNSRLDEQNKLSGNTTEES